MVVDGMELNDDTVDIGGLYLEDVDDGVVYEEMNVEEVVACVVVAFVVVEVELLFDEPIGE